MLSIIRYSILLLALSSCAASSLKYEVEGDIAPQFVDHVNEFMDLTNIDRMSVSMKFADLDERAVGRCYHGRLLVEIDLFYWASARHYEREALVFHELLHCVFNQRHRNLRMSDGCKASYLHKFTDSNACLKKNREYLIKEMQIELGLL